MNAQFRYSNRRRRVRARLELNHARGIRNEDSPGRGTNVKEEWWGGELEVA